MPNEPLSFLARLKQHHIYRVVVAYAVGVWIVIQVASRVFPWFGWSGAVPILIIILILGFPVVLVLAWVFIKPKDPVKIGWQQRHWKLSAIVAAAVVVLVVISGFYAWRFSEHHAFQEVAAVPTAVAKVAALTPAPAATTAIPAKSIAVLPFENLSGDPKQAYFSDGITEEILNALAQIPDLKVTARTSAFAFSGKNQDPRKIGEALGVANLLEGSVQKSGDEVRINVQLVDTRTGYQRWSEKYDRKLTSIFAVEDDISNAIAGKLRVQLTSGAGQALVVAGTKNPQAHDLYLRGLSLLAARSMRDTAAAFRQAVKFDPDYAQAWGGLAEIEVLLPTYGLDSVADALPRAQSAAQRALTLDPNTASAYVALGIIYSVRWQWAEADRAFQRALTLAPGDAEAVDQYAQFLYAVGQLEPALRAIDRAQKLDPLSAVIGAIRASILGALHRYDAAAAQIERTLAAHPDSSVAHSIATLIAVNRHRYAEAEAQIRLTAKFKGTGPYAKALIERGIADPALRAAAVHSLETSPANAGLRSDPIVYALFLTQLGEHDRALGVLESNIVSRSSDQAQLLWDPSFDPIRNDPRFKAVLKKMGLPYTPPETVAP